MICKNTGPNYSRSVNPSSCYGKNRHDISKWLEWWGEGWYNTRRSPAKFLKIPCVPLFLQEPENIYSSNISFSICMPIAFLRFEVPNHYAQHPLLFLAEDMLFKVKVSAILALFSFPWISSMYAMLCYAKSLQSCPSLCDPIDGSHQASLSMGFSRQEHWSGLPFHV